MGGTHIVGKSGQLAEVTSGGGIALASTSSPLIKLQAVGEAVTCTNANTDYAAQVAMVAGTTYVTVYCAAECKVAMGEATSATIGYRQGAGAAVTFPTTVSGTAADDKPHCQSPTAGAVVTFTYGKG
jgi:hypothetical protein